MSQNDILRSKSTQFFSVETNESPATLTQHMGMNTSPVKNAIRELSDGSTRVFQSKTSLYYMFATVSQTADSCYS
jgi:hypothetical protein